MTYFPYPSYPNFNIPQGWQCPVCGKINSPSVMQCPCPGYSTPYYAPGTTPWPSQYPYTLGPIVTCGLAPDAAAASSTAEGPQQLNEEK